MTKKEQELYTEPLKLIEKDLYPITQIIRTAKHKFLINTELATRPTNPVRHSLKIFFNFQTLF